MNIKSVVKSKKFRYGSASVVLTAVVLALLVIVNAVFSLLASHYHWTVDMTEERLYTLSDTTYELLDETFKPDENGNTVFDGKITIRFLQERDKIEDSTLTYGGDKYLKQIHELAKKYESSYPDSIEIAYVDMYAHPGVLTPYKEKNSQLSPTSVVFDNNEGQFNVVSYTKFLAYDSSAKSYVGFTGEHKITSTLLSLCNHNIAYVTEGHGEDELSAAFINLLESCGYEVKNVNLQTTGDLAGMIAQDQPRLVVINNPKREFVGSGSTQRNEIRTLQQILNGDYTDPSNPTYASLLVFADPDSGCKNEHLNSLLNEWGLIVRAEGRDKITETMSAAIDDDLTVFSPEFVTASDEFASSLVSSLAAADNYKVALNGSGTVKIVDVSESTGASTKVLNGAVLTCSAGAQNERGDAANSPVMALSQKMNIVQNSITKYNYAVVCADTSIVSDTYLNSSAYANEAVMVNLVRMTTNDKESTPKIVNIEYKDYVEETNVEGVSQSRKQFFLITMAVILPLAMVTAGIVVFVKRRNK